MSVSNIARRLTDVMMMDQPKHTDYESILIDAIKEGHRVTIELPELMAKLMLGSGVDHDEYRRLANICMDLGDASSGMVFMTYLKKSEMQSLGL